MIIIDPVNYILLNVRDWLDESFDDSEYTLSSVYSLRFSLSLHSPITLQFDNDKNEIFFYLKFGDISKSNGIQFQTRYGPATIIPE